MATLRPRGPLPSSTLSDRRMHKQPERLANLMFERRVCRGAPFKLVKKQEAIDASSSSVLLRERLMRAQCAAAKPSSRPRPQQQQQPQREPQQQTAAAAKAAEKEVGMQTDPHLVLLTAAAKETEAAAQTDKVTDRPVSPLVAIKAELVDADTQIQEGELFNFDEEVVPVLEVLVGRVIEQSLSEVVEEEELRAIRQQREAFERERLQQLIAVQALEAAEERRQQEAARRLTEERAQHKLRGIAAQKAAATACARRLLCGLEEAILQQMRDSGEFLKPVTKEAIQRATERSNTHRQVIANVAAAALAPVAVEAEEIVTMRERKAALHIEKKRKQVAALNDLVTHHPSSSSSSRNSNTGSNSSSSNSSKSNSSNNSSSSNSNSSNSNSSSSSNSNSNSSNSSSNKGIGLHGSRVVLLLQLAQRSQEATERRLMAAADDIEETRAWEQKMVEREEEENELLKAEDFNVLLLSEDDPTDPQDDPSDPQDELDVPAETAEPQ
ncbi:hypothetical protein Efla_006576 [Eimeria flavescens]